MTKKGNIKILIKDSSKTVTTNCNAFKSKISLVIFTELLLFNFFLKGKFRGTGTNSGKLSVLQNLQIYFLLLQIFKNVTVKPVLLA